MAKIITLITQVETSITEIIRLQAQQIRLPRIQFYVGKTNKTAPLTCQVVLVFPSCVLD